MSLKDQLLATQAQLRDRMAELRKEVDAVKAPAKPLWDQVDALVAQQQAVAAQIEALTAQANALEQPKLFDLKMDLAQVARTEAAITTQLKAMG